MRASALAELVGGRLEGPDVSFVGVAPLPLAGGSDAAFADRVIPDDCAAAVVLAKQPHRGCSVVVVSDPKYSMDDYGVWSVERDATIKPLNERAKEVWGALSLSTSDTSTSDPTEIAAGCTPVIRNLQEANDRMYAFLSSCFPELRQSEMKTNRDTINHVWLVVTDEPYVDNTSERKKSVWSVDGSGRVRARNSSAEATMAIVDSGNC